MAVELIGPLVDDLLACAVAALSADPVGRAQISPGATVAWDDCCEGQLWVRVVSIHPTGAPYPGQDTRQNCGVLLWAANLAVGVLRCAAVVNDQGQAPSPATLTAEAHRMLADEAALSEAVRCCFAPNHEYLKTTLGAWTPLGPDGGCVGGEWALTISVDVCQCPPKEEIP